jgi:pilus assembly protein Flp/PilA
MFLKLYVDLQSRVAEVVRNAREEEGQTMVEYALILFLISVVAIALLTDVGTQIKVVFQSVKDALTP